MADEKIGVYYASQKNPRKKLDWHSDFSGMITLPNGKVHFINVWENYKSKAGNEMIKVEIGDEVKGSSNKSNDSEKKDKKKKKKNKDKVIAL
tara:strand:- start:425 stop:700 length:276 start_codon:yes stop_codon:yes gene_type:complete